MAVLSDNGSEFCNEVWQLQLEEVTTRNQPEQTRTSQSNPERAKTTRK